MEGMRMDLEISFLAVSIQPYLDSMKSRKLSKNPWQKTDKLPGSTQVDFLAPYR